MSIYLFGTLPVDPLKPPIVSLSRLALYNNVYVVYKPYYALVS
jgi:hypothetical protein